MVEVEATGVKAVAAGTEAASRAVATDKASLVPSASYEID